MSQIYFTDQHEWVRLDGEEATIGITKFAAEALGDVVFVELPAGGKKVTAGGEAAVVESVKAASEVYSPVGGEVTAANAALMRIGRGCKAMVSVVTFRPSPPRAGPSATECAP